MKQLYPLLFRPIYKDYIWGGNKISSFFNRNDITGRCAESWEISGFPEDSSIVLNGSLEGDNLYNITNNYGSDLVGVNYIEGCLFPLLIKILDVNTKLSIQVHPNVNQSINKLNGLNYLPKNELWYILDCHKLSNIFAGINEPYNISHIRNNLISYDSKKGDMYYIPGGLVHSASSGNLIFEVQQTSKTTFRIDDWDRGRELHLHDAKNTIVPCLRTIRRSSDSRQNRIYRMDTPLFNLSVLNLNRQRRLITRQISFAIVFCEKGKYCLEYNNQKMILGLGQCVLIPANFNCVLTPIESSKLLIARSYYGYHPF